MSFKRLASSKNDHPKKIVLSVSLRNRSKQEIKKKAAWLMEERGV